MDIPLVRGSFLDADTMLVDQLRAPLTGFKQQEDTAESQGDEKQLNGHDVIPLQPGRPEPAQGEQAVAPNGPFGPPGVRGKDAFSCFGQ